MKTWKPTTAGILSILAGALSLVMAVLRITISPVDTSGFVFQPSFGIVCIPFGLIAIVGGIFAIRRQVWGLALAGAICALFPSHPYGHEWWSPVLGILAIVFVALSKNEFSSSTHKPSARP